MGACLCKGGADRSDGSVTREVSRKRSRSAFGTAGSRNYVDRGPSTHKAPVPDFGVSSVYRVMELLGEGGTGQTWMCQDLKTHRRVAIKFIPRPLAKVLVPMVSQEIQLQAQLSEGHLGLVRVESALLSKSHLGLVMEYVDGGTLTQYVTKRASNKGERGGLHLTEDEARYFFRQLIAAVEYLHVSHVAHRDLKMCNVVLTQRRPPALKLCDFGFAKGWDESSMMATRIGTPVYMSPQLIESKNEGKTYSATAADVWACGVMLFAMLLGRFPYDHVGHPDPNSSGAHVEVWNEQMKASNGDWRSAPRVAPHINLLSDECKDLLGKMLETDERRRITIPDIRKHTWFTSELPPYLGEALQDTEERQARLAKVMEAATEAQIKRRNKAVHDLIVMAGQTHNSVEPYSVNGAGSRRIGSGPISAIFEVGTEYEAGTPTAGAGGGGGSFATGRTPSPTSPTDSPLRQVDGGSGGDAEAATAQNLQHEHGPSPAAAMLGGASGVALSAVGSSGEGRRGGGGLSRATSSRSECDIIMIELAAVAKRTKSDGLVLMAAFDPEGAEMNRNCDSDESDPAVESSCGGGATTVGVGGGSSTADVSNADCGGGGEESAKATGDGRALQATCEVAASAATAAAAASDAAVGATAGDKAVEVQSLEAAAVAAPAAVAAAASPEAVAGAAAAALAVPAAAAAADASDVVIAAEQVALEPAAAAAAEAAGTAAGGAASSASAPPQPPAVSPFSQVPERQQQPQQEQ